MRDVNKRTLKKDDFFIGKTPRICNDLVYQKDKLELKGKITMREELYHPMFVHFPIVLFLLALVFKIAVMFLSKYPELKEKCHCFATIALYSTPMFYLVSMYLGDASFDKIKTNFCDLRAITLHEEMAKWGLLAIILTLALESLSHIEKIKQKADLSMKALVLLMMIIGNFLIFKTAHSGGELVYEKGAAVKAAPQICR
jgi:uncharacterized membrane protein